MEKKELFSKLYAKDKVDAYRVFQKIEKSIEVSDELYIYFDEILKMLVDEKSYVRVRGFRVITKLAKWDKDNKIDKNIEYILNELQDEKPTNVRQCISSLKELIYYKPKLANVIRDKLLKIDILKYNESMRDLIKKDICNITEGM